VAMRHNPDLKAKYQGAHSGVIRSGIPI